ncbi:hydroxymethylglutaryl-CoA reductase [Candidatus Woesearchaeota archaeon]|nr:hydroxymethylglutaryl-CoA reductase [Candidatus Woesearchaeota archaeon]
MPLKEFEITSTSIPTYLAGPLRILGSYAKGEYIVPLATLETPLGASVGRGAKATREEGITTIIKDTGWTRAPVLEGPSAQRLRDIIEYVTKNYQELKQAANTTTRYGKITSIEPQQTGKHLYLRITMQNADAGGHNMTTKAAQAIVDKICAEFKDIKLISISGNYCTDKKVSAVNSISGRGKKVIAETWISEKNCETILKTTPDAIHKVNTIKNLEGSIIAGSICSANAHFANILAAMYLATGQDIANIVEGSQGITQTDITKKGELYFSVTIPNIVVGTVKSKDFPEDQKTTLERLGCYGSGRPIGTNAKKLAEIIGATVLAGELNLLAVLSKDKELIDSHERIERGKTQSINISNT